MSYDRLWGDVADVADARSSLPRNAIISWGSDYGPLNDEGMVSRHAVKGNWEERLILGDSGVEYFAGADSRVIVDYQRSSLALLTSATS